MTTFVRINCARHYGAESEELAGPRRAAGHKVHTPTRAVDRPAGDVDRAMGHADAVASAFSYLRVRWSSLLELCAGFRPDLPALRGRAVGMFRRAWTCRAPADRVSARSAGTPRLLHAVILPAVLSAFVLISGTALAQTVEKLVGNAGQPVVDGKYMILDKSNHAFGAAFRTGDEPGGYVATALLMNIAKGYESRFIETSGSLHECGGSWPGRKITDLIRSERVEIGAMNSWSFLENHVLSPNACYRFVLACLSGCANDNVVGIGFTRSHSEDSDSRAGWSIANAGWSRVAAGSWHRYGYGVPQIRVEGRNAGGIHVVEDGIAVTSVPVALESGDTYGPGEQIEFTVTFSRPVRVPSGQDPGFRFSLDGNRTRTAAYVSGSGTRSLVFAYTVEEGDRDRNGIRIGDGRATWSAAEGIEDRYPNRNLPVVLDHPEIGTFSGHKVNGAIDRPRITLVRVARAPHRCSTYGLGEAIDLKFIFDQAVTVTGAPEATFLLRPDTPAGRKGEVLRRQAVYHSGSGTNELVFRHVVQEGDGGVMEVRAAANALAKRNIAQLEMPWAGAIHKTGGTAIAVLANGQTGWLMKIDTGLELDTLQVTGTTNDAGLVPDFERGTLDYTASVAGAVDQVTVVAQPVSCAAEATIEPPDADASAPGHQVALRPGNGNLIRVAVRPVGAPSAAERTYRVRVAREGTPAVHIAAKHDVIGAGVDAVVFTLTRDAITDAVTATVNIDQEGSWLPSVWLSRQVRFAAGTATATLTFNPIFFLDRPRGNGTLTATVAPLEGYDVSGASAAVRVVVTDEPPITVEFDRPSYTFSESAGGDPDGIYVVVTADAALPRAPAGFRLVVSSRDGTATAPGDYRAFHETVAFGPGDFALAADGSFVARKRVGAGEAPEFLIVDDQVSEADESFTVSLARQHGTPGAPFRTRLADGSLCDGICESRTPVRIVDDDQPELSLAVTPPVIGEADDPATAGQTENVATVTASIVNGKTFPTDRTITLSFAGTAAPGTDYTVSPPDADDGVPGHQVILAAGRASTDVVLTAVANDIAEDVKEIEIAAALDGGGFGATQAVTITDDDGGNAPPAFAAETVSLDVREQLGLAVATRDAPIGEPLAATDADGDRLVYSLEGVDRDAFTLDPETGQLGKKTGLGYDHEWKAVYSVTVRAEDGNGGSDSLAVTVNVTDRTGERAARPAKPQLSVPPDSNGQLSVAWEAPDRNGGPEIVHYRVEYRPDAEDGSWTQWPHEGTGTSATITGLLPDTAYRVRVRAWNGDTASHWSDTATVSGTPGNVPATGAPSIIGSALLGQELVAGPGTINDVNGLDDVDYRYYWLRLNDAGWFQWMGFIGQRYTVTFADIGRSIQVRAKFLDDQGNLELLTSAAVGPVPETSLACTLADPANRAEVWRADVSAARVAPGAVLAGYGYDESGGGALSDETVRFGANTHSVEGILVRAGDGALEFTLDRPIAAGIGARLRLHVCDSTFELANATLTGSTYRWQNSGLAWTAGQTFEIVLSAPLNSAATGAPAISGNPRAGETVSADMSEVSDADGLGDASYTYQWILVDGDEGTDIPGATASSYPVTANDAGKMLKVRVSFTDDIGNSETLTSAATATVTAPLTAAFSELPHDHDGSAFAFTFKFSESPDVSYLTIRDAFFTVEGGSVKRVRRRENDSNAAWRVTVAPDGYEEVTVSFLPTSDCAAESAVCTGSGEALESSGSAVVPGPATISVADAQVTEGSGATLDFVVTLSRVRTERTTVRYATGDGTATAGADYTQTSGKLVFAPHVTAQAVSVPVLQDNHDDDGETVIFTLSDAVGARLGDAEATGTIVNADPMPKGWIARFGRTVTEQVLDAVETRMQAPRTPGAEASLGGHRMDPGTGFEADSPSPPVRAGHEAGDTLAPEDGWRRVAGERSLAEWPRSAVDEDERRRRPLQGGSMTERDLLLGSSFSLASGEPRTGHYALWGRGSVSRFDGRDGELTQDGEVASAMLGADWSRGAVTAGLIVGHSLGEGGYRAGSGSGSGTLSSTLTGLYPWARYAASERTSVWGAAGYGAGTLTLKPVNADGEGQAALRTDLDLAMAALGARVRVLKALEGGGFELAVKTDAMAVRTRTAAVRGDPANLASATADVTRFSLGLEGKRPIRFEDAAVLTPRLEVGVRHDGGDAETGFGLDVGGGLAWSDPQRGMSAEFRGRGLVGHESKGFRDVGLSGSLSWDPKPDSDRGTSLTLTQTFGEASSGGVNALFERSTLAGLAVDDNGRSGTGQELFTQRHLELKIGYGFPAFGDRFTQTPELGVGLTDYGRNYSLGWRLSRRTGRLGVTLEARRHENDNAARGAGRVEHTVGVRLNARF